MMSMTYQLAQIHHDELLEQAARHRLARQAAMLDRPSRRSPRRRPPRRAIHLLHRGSLIHG
jgi:hypothetical protein